MKCLTYLEYSNNALAMPHFLFELIYRQLAACFVAGRTIALWICKTQHYYLPQVSLLVNEASPQTLQQQIRQKVTDVNSIFEY